MLTLPFRDLIKSDSFWHFQTTAKTMKGGASIKYNSSATINLKVVDGERVTTIEKGRYGTQGWMYSIDQEKIITEF